MSILIPGHPVDDPNPRVVLRVCELSCSRGSAHLTVRTVYLAMREREPVDGVNHAVSQQYDGMFQLGRASRGGPREALPSCP